MHDNNISDKKIEDYKIRLNDDKFFNGQLKYSLILLDRYIDFDKAKILGRLFYLHIEGQITWVEYKKYSEILDRLLLNDLEEFVRKNNNYEYEEINDSVLRLVSLGLLVETTNSSPFVDDGRGGIAITSSSMNRVLDNNKIYILTDFGKKLIEILLEIQ
ncbi:MAG: hypothetical protein UDG84_00850 [Thomasclavelia sp.]|nr:hypothetical protein [Thomasclavelia sp.]